jgi:hypothetical protein
MADCCCVHPEARAGVQGLRQVSGAAARWWPTRGAGAGACSAPTVVAGRPQAVQRCCPAVCWARERAAKGAPDGGATVRVRCGVGRRGETERRRAPEAKERAGHGCCSSEKTNKYQRHDERVWIRKTNGVPM